MMNLAERYGGVAAMVDYEFIRQNYPPVISSEQLRKILHVSRRRCIWLLKHYIPHNDNGNQTRRYTIDLEVALTFLADFEQAPERYSAAPGQFSTYDKYVRNKRIKQEKSYDESIKPKLTLKWQSEPEVLDSKAVSKLTGYSIIAVNRWIQKGKLKSVKTPNGRITSKEWLIGFWSTHT